MFFNNSKQCSSKLILIDQDYDYVIVLHGITKNAKHMGKILQSLIANNFNTLAISYPSLAYRLETLIKMVCDEIIRYIPLDAKIHFVGHSMGGLIIRGILKNYNSNTQDTVKENFNNLLPTDNNKIKDSITEHHNMVAQKYNGKILEYSSKFLDASQAPSYDSGFNCNSLENFLPLINIFPHKNIGKVVMIGTPNLGSELADLLKNFFLYKWLFGLAGQDLITNQDHIRHLFGKITYPLGIIAGDYVAKLSLAYYLLPKPNDGRVALYSTILSGMQEHIVIKDSHERLVRNTDVIMQSINFLKHGCFIKK